MKQRTRRWLIALSYMTLAYSCAAQTPSGKPNDLETKAMLHRMKQDLAGDWDLTETQCEYKQDTVLQETVFSFTTMRLDSLQNYKITQKTPGCPEDTKCPTVIWTGTYVLYLKKKNQADVIYVSFPGTNTKNRHNTSPYFNGYLTNLSSHSFQLNTKTCRFIYRKH